MANEQADSEKANEDDIIEIQIPNQRILVRAKEYCNAANMLHDQSGKSSTSEPTDLSKPALMVAAFAIELYLKSLASSYNYLQSPDQPQLLINKTHKYNQLLDNLDDDTKHDLRSCDDQDRSDETLKDFLTKYPDLFVKSRCDFDDSSTISDLPTPDRGIQLMNQLHEAISKLPQKTKPIQFSVVSGFVENLFQTILLYENVFDRKWSEFGTSCGEYLDILQNILYVSHAKSKIDDQISDIYKRAVKWIKNKKTYEPTESRIDPTKGTKLLEEH